MKWLRRAVTGCLVGGVVLSWGCGTDGGTPPADRSLYVATSSPTANPAVVVLHKLDYRGTPRATFTLGFAPGPGLAGVVADHSENVYLLRLGVAGRQAAATAQLVKIDATGHQAYAIAAPASGDTRVERLGIGSGGLFLITSHGAAGAARAVAQAGVTLRSLTFAGVQTASFALPTDTVDEGFAAVLQDAQSALYVVVKGDRSQRTRLLKYTAGGTLVYDKALRSGYVGAAAAIGPDSLNVVTRQGDLEYLERYGLDGSFRSYTTLVGDARLNQTHGLVVDSTGRTFRAASGQGDAPHLYEEVTAGFLMLSSPTNEANATVWGMAGTPGP